jgi:hypothetical protein
MIVEHLVKPCVTDVLSFMRFEKHLKAIENFSLSNSTVSRRLEGISCNSECELISRIQKR